MPKVRVIRQIEVGTKFESYPDRVRHKLEELRALIIEAADEIEGVSTLEESLKWGEPSYKTKQGSPIRIDWKDRAPNQVSIYFNCNTHLVETFKKNYGNLFRYENNRAIHFLLDEVVPEKELKHCVSLALKYHRLKDLPFLGT